MYFIIFEQGLKDKCDLSSYEIMFTILSAAAHDIDHPGSNNVFETKNQSKLAVLYNDISVLENHHAASFFFLLDNMNYNCNIFSAFSSNLKADARKMIIENILCTDMSKHFALQAEIKGISELSESEQDFKGKNKLNLIKCMVHAVDIGNPTRKFPIAFLWGKKIVQEFFDQGDKERALGLPIAFGCDRHTGNFAKS